MLFKTFYNAFLAVSAVIALTACTASVPTTDVRTPQVCQVDKFETLLWKPQTALNGLTLPRGTRVIYPNQAVTMDHRPERLNISIGKSERIERVYCG